MTEKRKLELLAPAKNLECGLAAIDHGADAVYIGAPKFGARSAAGNSLDDISTLVKYAHQFGARVYVTVNTIIYESELDDTQELIIALSQIGVDAILIQDMGTLEMRRVALETVGYAPLLHASTQCDTRTADKVRWFRSLGFSRVVLARELSLEEISAIHRAVPDMELEVFVHGALCVSYSGLCYVSQKCFDRSANRGACAQFCRMKFDLEDAEGHVIERARHLLSLKDMNQLEHLSSLVEAGASSFKIEGRLKDLAYVKNVVSAYSIALNKIVSSHPDLYQRASWGTVRHTFTPDLKKTFSRGYTDYFYGGRKTDIASFDTPKALGERVGTVKEIRHDSFNVAGTAVFANGDGLCFVNDKKELEGFRVNRVVGNRLYPFKMPAQLRPHTVLYRNNDQAFTKILAGGTAERRLPVSMSLGISADGYVLTMRIQDREQGLSCCASSSVCFEHQTAQKSQEENMKKQLSKLGNTIFSLEQVVIEAEVKDKFIPSGMLSELRRQVVDDMMIRLSAYQRAELLTESNAVAMRAAGDVRAVAWQHEYAKHGYLFNVANHMARDFYIAQGFSDVDQAFELTKSGTQDVLMQCRHCIRYTLGYCVRRGGECPTWKEPLYLKMGDGRRFRLEFNCAECQMNLYAE